MEHMDIDHDDEPTGAAEGRRVRYAVWALLILAIALATTAPFWAGSVFASW